MAPKKKAGRPSKARLAAAALGSWDRGAEKQEKPGPRKRGRGRPSKRTEAARALAAARVASQTPEQRSAIAAAGGRAASHPGIESTCKHCGETIPTARQARKHPAQCKVLIPERIERRAAKRRQTPPQQPRQRIAATPPTPQHPANDARRVRK